MQESTISVSEKYSRQELIKGWNQEKLGRANVFIAGAGAFGNEVSKNLALVGVGHLVVVDMDTVEESNLNRMVLFSQNDVGKNKAKAIAEELARLSPTTAVEAYGGTLQSYFESHVDRLETVNVLASCLDNMEARFLLNAISIRFGIPLVDGGMMELAGRVQVCLPPYTPCLECNASPRDYSNIGVRYSCTAGKYVDLTEKQRTVRVATVSTTTSIIAGIQSQEILKILLGFDTFRETGLWPSRLGKPLQTTLQYDGRTNRLMTVALRANSACHVCGSEYEAPVRKLRKQVIDIPETAPLGGLIAKIRGSLPHKDFMLVRGLDPFPDPKLIHARLDKLAVQIQLLAEVLRRQVQISDEATTMEPRAVRLAPHLKELGKELPLLSDIETIDEYLAALKRVQKAIVAKIVALKEVINDPDSHIPEWIQKYDSLKQGAGDTEQMLGASIALRDLDLPDEVQLNAIDHHKPSTSDYVVLLKIRKAER
jgi:molybdopterin/thiamine biosynthesis adenylyltransferase